MSAAADQPAADAARAERKADQALALAREIEPRVLAGRPADVLLARFFQAHPECGSRDRRFLGEAIFAAWRWRGWVGGVAEHGPEALVAAHALDAEAWHPVWRAAAEKLGPPWRDAPAWGAWSPAEKAAQWAARGLAPRTPDQLTPDWARPALAEAPAAEWPALLESWQRRPPLWLRAAGISGADLAARLAAAGETAVAHPALPGAARLDRHPHLPTLEKQIGRCFHTQDIASQAVGALCAARPGETWWDTCAGAGGKTLALLDAGARVLATDVRDRALAELGRRARALGLPAPHTRRMDAAREPIAETFDGVLVDAPCSGLGMWSRAPDARWRTPPDAPAARAAEQRALLARAADAVAPGGRLVYSVCTLTRAETDEVADAFLAARADFHAESRAVTPAWGPPAARHWILPRHGPGGAMFVAVFRRVG